MLGLFKSKKSEPKITYHRHKCECGSDMFRHITPMSIETWESEGITTNFLHMDESDILFECFKCGELYNQYGEKEEHK